MNEIEGVVTDSNGKVVHSIFGKWHESIFQGDPPSATCIWRASESLIPGNVIWKVFTSGHIRQTTKQSLMCVCVCLDSMPVDQEQYYGFTQFAVEMNELDSTLRPLLPPTDTRFRPDQRLGNCLSACYAMTAHFTNFYTFIVFIHFCHIF